MENKYVRTLKAKGSVTFKKLFFSTCKGQVISDFISYSKSRGGGGSRTALNSKRRNGGEEERNEREKGGGRKRFRIH